MGNFWIYTGVLLGIIVILAWPVQQVDQHFWDH